jgi:putative flippase GtrA
MSIDRNASNLIPLRLIRYGMTAGTAAVVDLGLFSILCPAYLPVAAAATLSFICAAVVNYALTTTFVFNEKFGARRFGVFLVFATVGLVFNVCVTVLVARATPAPLPLAKAVGIGTAFLFNFWLNAAFVFGPSATNKAFAGDSR